MAFSKLSLGSLSVLFSRIAPTSLSLELQKDLHLTYWP